MRVLLPAVLALSIGNLMAAGIAGRWSGTVDTDGKLSPLTLTLYQNGQQVTGTFGAGDAGAQSPILSAELHGNQLSFDVRYADLTVSYRLTLSEDSLKGDASVPGQVSKVTLTRARSTNPKNAFQDGARSMTSPPILIHKVDAEYTKEARAARLQGTVLLQVMIDTTGTIVADRIQVLHSLGLGLDEKAIEAVKQFKWKPALKDGLPAAVFASVEVNFKL